MAICEDCGQEMHGSNSCKLKHVIIDGIKYKRDTNYYDDGKTCHDCGIKNKVGNVHHFGCDIERCPKCGDQFFCCDCGERELIP